MIWIITDLFYPNVFSTGYYATELFHNLKLRGHNVKVVTVDSGNLGSEQDIIRVKSYSNEKHLLIRLFLSLWISFRFYALLLKQRGKIKQIIVFSNPATNILFSYLLKFINAEKIWIAHDLFPVNLFRRYRYKKWFGKLEAVLSYLFNPFDKVIVCGRDMEEYFQDKLKVPSEKIQFIPNWSGIDQNECKKSIERRVFGRRKVEFQYSGNLGKVQIIPALCDAFREYYTQCNLDIYGLGYYRSYLEELYSRRNQGVKYCGSFDRKDMVSVLSACDVSIISLDSNMVGLGVPSKLYATLSLLRPILFLGNSQSEIGLVIEKHGNGIIVDDANLEKGISYFLNFNQVDWDVMRVRCIAAYNDMLTKEQCLKKYYESIV